MNVLIIGNNPKHAKLFSLFADDVSLLIGKNEFRPSSEMEDYRLLYCDADRSFHQRVKDLQKIVAENKTDIVFTNRKDDLIIAKTAKLFGKRKFKIVCTFHSSIPWQKKIKVFFLAQIVRLCSDGCVCLSSFVYRDLVRHHISKKRLLFLPNTIEYENIAQKQDYSLNGKIRICYTAVVVPLKNQSLIIDVVNELKEKYSFDVHFWGDILNNEYYASLTDKIKMYHLEDSVFFDGRVDYSDVKRNLRNNDIYFSSSRMEMSPYNILEAKSAGLPILASNICGHCDLIDHMNDGYLYKDNDVQDAKEKLIKLIENAEERKRIALVAFNNVSGAHSYRIASEILCDFISGL